MIDWKKKLYQGYVSTGQSAATASDQKQLDLSQFPQHRHLITSYMPADKSVRVVDLGCGHGSLIHCLKSMGYGNVEGVDVSGEQVAIAHRLGMPEIVQGDLASFLEGKTQEYDVAFLMDVLEHLEKQEVVDMLELVRAAMKTDGRLIIHVPNAEGLFGMRIRYGDFTHQVCFTPKSIGQVLRATGFNRIEVYEERPLMHSMKSMVRRGLWALLTMRERLLLLAETGASGHVLSQNMLVIAEK